MGLCPTVSTPLLLARLRKAEASGGWRSLAPGLGLVAGGRAAKRHVVHGTRDVNDIMRHDLPSVSRNPLSVRRGVAELTPVLSLHQLASPQPRA